MATNDPPDFAAASEPAVSGTYGYSGQEGGEEPEPVPGWRKPIAFVGWAVLIAVLIGLIIFGIIQLLQGPEPTPATPPTTNTSATTTTTTPPTATTPPTTTTAPPTTATTITDTATPSSAAPSQTRRRWPWLH